MKFNRKHLLITGSLLFIIFVSLIAIKLYRVHEARQSGILLSFDDYSAENWEEYFDLFDQYDAKVTFFVNCEYPTDFCYKAIERGHEIAFHSCNHIDACDASPEEIQKEIIDPIARFGEQGINLTTFAYPYGSYTSGLNELLLQHYTVLRGAYYYELNSKAELRHGFVESYSLDNLHFATDEDFEAAITGPLTELSNNVGAVASFFSHAIEGGDWCITKERLEILLKKADELNLKFYTFQDLQKD